MRRIANIDSLKALAVIAAASVVALAVSLPLLAGRVDRQSAAYEHELVSGGVAEALENAENRIESVAIWDGMLQHADTTPDGEWVRDNVISSNPTDPGNRAVYVIGADDSVMFAAERALPIAPPRARALEHAFAPLLATLRAREDANGARLRRLAPHTSEDAITGGATVLVEGQPFVVVASLIASERGTIAPLHARLPIILMASSFESTVLPTIVTHLRLDGVSLRVGSVPANMASLALTDTDGTTTATLTWSPRRPGLALLRGLLGPILLVVSGLGVAAILAYRRVTRSALALVASEARAQHLALHDQLTELPNRRHLIDRFAQTLARADRRGSSSAVLLVDLDRFKFVNDTHGHQCGDELIREVARRLSSTCRRDDVCARLGGDEFVILAADTEPAEAAALAERVLGRIAEPVMLSAATVHIAGTIGIAVQRGAGDPHALLRQADLALYRAKERHRGGYCFFEIEMDQAVQMRRGLELDLRLALEADAIDVAYQPQFDGDTLTGLETLARWTHPERGPISPAFFAPLAEECGLIDALGLAVMRRAFRDSRRWPGMSVGINLSAVQLRTRDFLPRLSALIEETQARPDRFEFEITEGVMMADDLDTQRTLTTLREMGFRLAIDDFGIGYSSLSYLRRFPIDRIKIDRSFIGGLGDDTVSESVVRAIVRMARALDLDVIAEGVETETQRRRLAAVGCRSIQGYLLGRPMPAEAIDDLVRERMPARPDAPIIAGC